METSKIENCMQKQRVEYLWFCWNVIIFTNDYDQEKWNGFLLNKIALKYFKIYYG